MGRALFGTSLHSSSCRCQNCCPDTLLRPNTTTSSPQSLIPSHSSPSSSSSRATPLPLSSSNDNRSLASSSESHLYTPLAQTLAETQASLQRATDVIESAYQRLALLRESIRRDIERMPYDLPESSPLSGVNPASMGPNHSAIVLSEQSGGVVEVLGPNNPNNTITESYERTTRTSSSSLPSSSSPSATYAPSQRPPWVSWNGFAINPYDQRAATSQPVDLLRASRRLATGSTTGPPTRRSLVEHYLLHRRDSNDPNDAFTSLGRSVEGRSSSSAHHQQDSTSLGSSIPTVDDESMSRIRDIQTGIDGIITRMNRQRDELSQASGGFRRTQGNVNTSQDQQQQQQQPEIRNLFEQQQQQFPRSSPRPEGSGGINGSGSAENQRSAWRTVSPPQDPQRLSTGNVTRVRTRSRASPIFPHSSPTGQQPPPAGPTTTAALTMTNPPRTERSHRSRVYPRAVPVITMSDNDDSEDEVGPFEFWLDRVRRVAPLQPLPPPPAGGGSGMNTVPPPPLLQTALREGLDRLRLSFSGATSGDSVGQRSGGMSGLGDGLTNGRRRRRGWARLDHDGNEIPTDEEEEYERNRSNMRARAQVLSSYYGRNAREALSLAPRAQDTTDSPSFSLSPSPPPLTFTSVTQTRLSLDDPEGSARVRLNSMRSSRADGSGSITPTVILSDSESWYPTQSGEKSNSSNSSNEDQIGFFGCSTPFAASPLPLPLVRTESSPALGVTPVRKQAGKRRYVRVSAQGPRAGR